MTATRTVLVTRPVEDAEPLIRLLAETGIVGLPEPMLTIVAEASAPPDLDGVQALLMTSANGVRAFAARSAERSLPLLAVGDATARAAREAGFTTVASAGGDVEDLARLAVARLDPAGGVVLHVAGSRVAGDLAGRLAEAGFDCRRTVLYRAETAQRLSPAATAAIAERRLDGVLFFSPRTATTFVRLIERAGLVAAAVGMDAFCLSPAVAEAARVLRWRRVVIAERPDQDSLLAAIQKGAGNGSAAGC